ncbi:PilX N-terminal domain-containing pilus assembly protein [Pseudomonas putida]|uniref:pilus assembly PilX family protein n=1 Tax=Pseudomonas putida TaxID=303 RepID=UPI002363B996|nr:PilX N-terminal domain-containing pilus assembly protein [Pseudomonas putida]MDD1966782.1 PilX N-terminal domain-containing pilus assembly protein [Pseudomonas putida]
MNAERGAVLIAALAFLVLVTLLATSSMQNATLQEKVAGSLQRRNLALQAAETVLRTGEAQVAAPGFLLPQCSGPVTCMPPPEALTLSGAGSGGGSGVNWLAGAGGLYGIQHLGQTEDPAHGNGTASLYRITAVVIQGSSRTVLESIHTAERRIMWRQRQ